jgi:cardiolipin synthase
VKLITPASWITLSRIALTPLVVYFFIQGLWGLGFIFFSIAMLTDLLDGFVARKFGQESKLGQILDPIADKTLLSSTMYTLLLILDVSWQAKACMWFLIIKECILLFGGGILWFRYHIFIPPTILSRLVSLCEVALVAILIFSKVCNYNAPECSVHAALMINVFISSMLLLRYLIFLIKKDSK